MNIIYKKNIMEKIIQASEQADSEGKEIEKIVLTVAEWRELERLSRPKRNYAGARNLFFNGIKVEREDF